MALSTDFLKAMLDRRKFAYEQTLTFLIHAILLPTFGNPPCGVWRIRNESLGEVADYDGDRGFREATTQVERTERMLKVLWRDAATEISKKEFSVADFETLDRRSWEIRRAALVSFANILNASAEMVAGVGL